MIKIDIERYFNLHYFMYFGILSYFNANNINFTQTK